MRTQSIAFVLVACLIAAGHPQSMATASRPLRLATFHSPPLQIAPRGEEGPITGTATSTVRCILGDMGLDARIRVRPPRRAQLQLKRNQVDGIFSLDATTALEPMAWPSAPIALEKWHFVSREPFHTLDNPRIGVVRGSNEASWLASQGRSRVIRVSSHQQLLPMLRRNRVDAILEDIQVFQYRATFPNGARATLDQLHTTFVRYAPLHFYASNALLQTHPGFLKTFDRELPACTGPSTTLNAGEIQRIREQAQALFKTLEHSVSSRAAATRLPPYEDFRALVIADRSWRAAMPGTIPELARTLLERPHSRALERWQQHHAPLVNEAFITDWQGAIAATSQVTSDFWQGDETKFRALLGTEPDTIAIAPLRYDESTRRFQVMVSRQVLNRHGQFAGAVVLGVDVEAALFRSEIMARSSRHPTRQ